MEYHQLAGRDQHQQVVCLEAVGEFPFFVVGLLSCRVHGNNVGNRSEHFVSVYTVFDGISIGVDTVTKHLFSRMMICRLQLM